MTPSRRDILVALSIAVVAIPTRVFASDDDHRRRRRRGHDGDGGEGSNDDHRHDHEDASRARQSGDVLPLRDILEEVRRTHDGEIVGIEFEKDDGIWVYEIKLVTPAGRYLEIYVDARSNKILKVEGK